MKHRAMTMVILAVVSGAGCTRCPNARFASSVDQVVSKYNANASRIPRLWARARISVTLRERPSDIGFRWSSGEPNGLLILQKNGTPASVQDFVLIIKELGREIGRVGTDTKTGSYYMWFGLGEFRSCLWGHLSLAGAPGVKDIPIDPIQLLSVLSVCELPADFTKPPLVAQTISHDPCAYVLTLIEKQPVSNKLLFKREVYFDRLEEKNGGKFIQHPCRPFMVRIFDERGIGVLTATMKQYRHVQLEDVDNTEKTQPEIPTRIKFRWEESGTEMSIELSEMTTADKFLPEVFLFHQNLPAPLRSMAKCVDANLFRTKTATNRRDLKP